MEILEITLKSKNNPNVFLVKTDGGEYTLHSDSIVKFSIAKGQYDDEKFVEATLDSSQIIAFNLCIKYLNASIKTMRQVRDYLKKKNFEDVVIDLTINKLKDYNIIDDKNFATMYIRSNPNFSKMKLKQKLITFGVNSSTIDELLSEVDEYEACLNSGRKFLKSKPIDEAVMDKLNRHLYSQGFMWETIKNVMVDLISN